MPTPAEAGATVDRMLQVTVVWARADAATEISLKLDAGARVADALARAIAAGLDAEQVRLAPVGIFGKRCTRETLLNDGDRVEIYRRLIADPKLARRRRAVMARHGRGPGY